MNFPTHGSSAGADVVDALAVGCGAGYKSGDLSSIHHGSAVCGVQSSSSSSSLLVDHQQRHYVTSGSMSSAAVSAGSVLPSFGFTQEQVRAASAANQRQPLADKQTADIAISCATDGVAQSYFIKLTLC